MKESGGTKCILTTESPAGQIRQPDSAMTHGGNGERRRLTEIRGPRRSTGSGPGVQGEASIECKLQRSIFGSRNYCRADRPYGMLAESNR